MIHPRTWNLNPCANLFALVVSAIACSGFSKTYISYLSVLLCRKPFLWTTGLWLYPGVYEVLGINDFFSSLQHDIPSFISQFFIFVKIITVNHHHHLCKLAFQKLMLNIQKSLWCIFFVYHCCCFLTNINLWFHSSSSVYVVTSLVISSQIKFIVDGHWQIDYQREIISSSGIVNNVLKV